MADLSLIGGLDTSYTDLVLLLHWRHPQSASAATASNSDMEDHASASLTPLTGHFFPLHTDPFFHVADLSLTFPPLLTICAAYAKDDGTPVHPLKTHLICLELGNRMGCELKLEAPASTAIGARGHP